MKHIRCKNLKCCLCQIPLCISHKTYLHNIHKPLPFISNWYVYLPEAVGFFKMALQIQTDTMFNIRLMRFPKYQTAKGKLLNCQKKVITHLRWFGYLPLTLLYVGSKSSFENGASMLKGCAAQWHSSFFNHPVQFNLWIHIVKYHSPADKCASFGYPSCSL